MSIDAVLGLASLIGAGALGYFVFRGGAGAALKTLVEANAVLEQELGKMKLLWAQEREALHQRIDELEELRAEDRDIIANLSESRDFTLAMQPIILELQAEAARNQQRFEGTMRILELIARNCGPEAEVEKTVRPIRRAEP